MITGNSIQSLVDLFAERQVFLYHACQLIDFQSYLRLGGIPSQALLETRKLPFTPFETDTIDRENNVWNKVFVNLSDFGGFFARGAKNVPNPYGPVLFKIRPSALLQASDVAICLWSAGAKGFNREHEALNALEEVENLFSYPSNVGPPQSTYVKYREQLIKEFGRPKAQAPEISCTVPDDVLSIQHVNFVGVDPYIINNRKLLDWVNEIKQRESAQFLIRERSHFPDRSRNSFYNQIADRIGEKIPSLHTLAQDNTCSQSLREWAEQIFHLEWQFTRYATYLRDGTLKLMRTVSMPSKY
ncbi:hypothetical protein F4054_02815 [Candidatus Poribacteria bacterium]|nr:hypothetical protein [Candidatus Poribacteria bacterium]MYG05555.1 hypothetical protein [Candidatus Poribacteria bacterium]MYK21175.1 hypothetical protein [Candidatus Poribacteria bacterium]